MATQTYILDSGSNNQAWTAPQDCRITEFRAFRSVLSPDRSLDWNYFTNGTGKWSGDIVAVCNDFGGGPAVQQVNYPVKTGQVLWVGQSGTNFAAIVVEIPENLS